jgi:hypothetical protein
MRRVVVEGIGVLVVMELLGHSKAEPLDTVAEYGSCPGSATISAPPRVSPPSVSRSPLPTVTELLGREAAVTDPDTAADW